ncbi:MAG TPA: hypothetical protein DEA43_04800 [Candidatus Moranbacteria bacterium]|nr:hypothetical protein [Candidatus Moranbacteria bacterium]HBT46173.1 hypothetical protein [Candidatus Moranbacteria bacterium]
MEKLYTYLSGLIDTALNNYSPTEAYFLIAGLFILIGILAVIVWYAIFYIIGDKKTISKQDIKKALIILAVLVFVGWLIIPVFGNWMWSYGTKGMPTIEDNNNRINEILQNKTATEQIKSTVKAGYKVIDVKNPAISFSFEVPEKWLTETRNSGEKELSIEEKKDFLADVLNGDSKYADYTREDFNKMSAKEIEKMFKGSDWLPFPIASIVSTNIAITYSDSNNQIDFYFLSNFDDKKTYFNEVVKGVNTDGVKYEGAWTKGKIGNNTVDIFSTPDGKKEISSGNSSGAKIYYIKLNNGKDMLTINKQVKGDNQFESGFENLIQTLQINTK